MIRESARVEVFRERLPAEPSSVTAARRFLRAAAGSALPRELRDAAELLVSELVTNAVVHAGTPVQVQVSVDPEPSLLVEVSDGSPRRPARVRFADTAGTGRGLRLLEEMSDEWGSRVGPDGKTVWFRLSRTGKAPGHRAGPASTGAAVSDARTIDVHLLNVPILLQARWQQDARALLREYLLVMVEGDDAAEQVVRHSECSDAVDLLDGCVPSAQVAGREGTGAEEVFEPKVTMPVPRESVAHFATLGETLERAVELSETDELLTPGTLPDERAFRDWVCRQVADQAVGKPPTPWPGG